MLFRILASSELEATLLRIDYDLAEQARSRACPHCGNILHSARYRRKPRCQKELGADSNWRHSFCCAREGCRRRTTPPSVRFLGRRVYPMITVILVGALSQGINRSRLKWLHSAFGVDKRTLLRWRQWWLETFPRTRVWHELRARHLLRCSDQSELPNSLLKKLKITTIEEVEFLLQKLSPLSIGFDHAR